MKIVIDISEYDLSSVKIGNTGFGQVYSILESIRNGIVLPKSHGDLIDRDELKKYAGWYNLATDKSIHAVLTSELYYIEPVIPAYGGDVE